MLKKNQKDSTVVSGKVIRISTPKTIVVQVNTILKHSFYDKYIKRSKNYTVHDEAESTKVGETVSIVQCRPMSKTKRWRKLSIN